MQLSNSYWQAAPRPEFSKELEVEKSSASLPQSTDFAGDRPRDFSKFWQITWEPLANHSLVVLVGLFAEAFFRTLALGLLDCKVDVVLARPEADFTDQPLQCPTAEYPCSAQLQSIPAVPNRRVSFTLPNRKVSLQCSTTKYPRSAQPQSIPAVLNCKVSMQCPIAKYLCSAQLQSVRCLFGCCDSTACGCGTFGSNNAFLYFM